MPRKSTIPKMKATSFRLTEEALEQLAALAERFHTSQAMILEHLIRDRFSISDSHKNAQRRDKSWKDHCEWAPGFDINDKKAEESAKYLFMSGYKKGWRDFQLRHDEDKYIIEL